MKSMNRLLAFLVILSGVSNAAVQPVGLTFPSRDGLEITAELYEPADATGTTPFIILCHQASWSRGEYKDTAQELVKLGYRCMAIDQRSGNTVNGVKNETAARALEAGKPTTYLDALQDIEAAVAYAKEHDAKGKLLLLGSSYSASLAIVVAAEHPKLVDGILSFSPGEYFEQYGQTKTYIVEAAERVKVPVFCASAKGEAPKYQTIWERLSMEEKARYIPSGDGHHGSRALWPDKEGNEEVWEAVKGFLGKYFPARE